MPVGSNVDRAVLFMKYTPVLFALLAAARTSGPAEVHAMVQNLAFKPDGTLLAVIVKYERYRPAAGVSAFPDGGRPRTFAQCADLYVIDLRTRALAHRGELPASPERRALFSPWLIGWAGDRVHFKISGCADSPGSDCYGPLAGTSLIALSSFGLVLPAAAAPSLVLIGALDAGTHCVSTGIEPYGVSMSNRVGAPRAPPLRFVGERLEFVEPSGPRRNVAPG
jgi:hypothetical protein